MLNTDNLPDPASAALQSAIMMTGSSIATLEPVYDAGNKLNSFRVLFANPSFWKLTGYNAGYSTTKQKTLLPAMFKSPEIRSHLIASFHKPITRSIRFKHQKQELSLVLQLTSTVVNDRLVITIIDITSLSHAREMLELQTTLMEESSRSLEAVRKALEAEIKRRGKLESKLRRLAGTDHLSGLANRRAFLEKATAEFRRSRRYQHPLSIVMLDLDRFKLVNDTHGHAAGDCVIVAISQLCQSLSRDGVDMVGRLGGEEFAILLPETTQQGSSNFAERLRLMIENTPVFCDIKKLKITASLGIASLKDQDRDFSTLLNRADAALYGSKQGGRNMVSSR